MNAGNCSSRYRVSTYDFRMFRFVVRHCGLTKTKAAKMAADYRKNGEIAIIRKYGGSR